ncbi:hypothetical protein ABT381_00260 [Streptomyces sp. NPDC000151]|uniref:hypothetical protein n=1 Tax=Streptomyces sp. NPDC000151 TaxID=3154244 RepID=UPI003325EE88
MSANTRLPSPPHADVCKAAVLALLGHAEGSSAAREALRSATVDTDADVRAYARSAGS